MSRGSCGDRPRRRDQRRPPGGRAPRFPDGAVRQIAEVVLDEMVGKEVLDRLLPPVFVRLPDDVALRVARECAPADPDAWLGRALQRWPTPERMPLDAVHEILSWEIADDALTPYLEGAIEQLVDAGETPRAHDLLAHARALVPRGDQARLHLVLARLLLEHPDEVASACDLLVVASHLAAGLGDPDLATELAYTMRGRWPRGTDVAVDAAVDRLRAVLDDLPEFSEWRDHRDRELAAMLRPALAGSTLHLVGGPTRAPWSDDLQALLDVREVRWHDGSDRSDDGLDWAAAIDPAVDIVVVIRGHCDRATRRGLAMAGVAYRPAAWSRRSVLSALQPTAR
ncbi:MAG: hypothetical protein R2695_14955 [Acidimicrobiales bacterium]